MNRLRFSAMGTALLIAVPVMTALLTACSEGSGGSDTSGDAGVDTVPDVDPADGSGDVDAPDAPVRNYTVRYVYDPFGDGPTTLPDDALTVADETTSTGLVIRMDDRIPWFTSSEGLPRDALTALDGLDGWGINAALAIIVDAPLGDVPSGVPESLDSEALRLVRLGPDGPVRVPYVVNRTEDGGLLVVPMLPLEPGARHALVGTAALRGEDGGDIDPGPVLRSLLAGTAEGPLAPMNDRYAELLDAVGLRADEIAFAVAFTTQSALETSRAIAADIRDREFAWATEPSCAPYRDEASGIVKCEGSFDAWSWRDEDGVFGNGDPVRQYRLAVSTWLPDTEGPFPTAVFGHGLAHGREVAGAMAQICAPLGIAVVAIDAVTHGEHPDAPDLEGMELFDFFALETNPLHHYPRRLRDNFRQSTWDKLQLLRLLESDPDVDGDDVEDLDLSRMVYIGESFGGIMAIEFLALTDRFQAAALQLTGGAVTRIISDAERFRTFTLIAGGADEPSETARFFPVIQTAVDAGDAATWAPWVLDRRLPEIGGTPLHLLVQLVIDDNTIPDVSSDALVRALGLPHVPPIARTIAMAAATDAAPVAGNAAEGTRTAGFFQFDRIRRSEGAELEPASHDYMPGSVEGTHQVEAFIRAWVEGELPVIVDPYADLDTPPLTEP